jgi:signal transduction histidine kinase
MKHQSLLRGQLLLLGGATLVCLVVGLALSIVSTRMDRSRFAISPTLFLAKLMDQLQTTHQLSHAEVVDLIKKSNDSTFPVSVEVLTKKKAQAILPANTELPSQPYEILEYGHGDAWHFPSRLVKLAGDDYLTVIYHPRDTPILRIFNVDNALLLLSVFMAAIFSIVYMFYLIRKKAHQAGEIISQLRAGDLSARFPVTKMDEVGLLMVEFNRMADEIQTLVETIRHSELGRMRRLQELAHDLRTPVASLKNLLEMLQSHGPTMEAHSRDEILNLSMKEVEYFQRLVEDLLFLAQVRDPKYAVSKTHIHVGKLIQDELDKMKANYPQIEVKQPLASELCVRGDGHLLRRLLRNAFENAFSFAKTAVEVRTEKHAKGVRILIRDDGPGFNTSTLNSFGEKRGTRFVSESPKGRLSVGLGSVIMKEVISVHCGTISIRNNEGAELEIVLPESLAMFKEESHPKLNSQL